MKVPLSSPVVTEEMKRRALEVLESGRFVKGPMVKEFEEKFSSYCGSKFGVGLNSGTSALYIALNAMGISKGDEVIVPSHTFIASATPILFVGAKPVFVEVGDDYLMDMDDLEKKISKKTKAVISVHLYGQMCDMKRLSELKEKHGFYIIEDSCQAHGAEHGGKKAGSFGDVGCFSFFPSKNMTVCGDGGMAITDNKELADTMRALRDHGRDYRHKNGKFESTILGLNLRMSEIFGAIGTEQLKHLGEWTERRRKIASTYGKSLHGDILKPFENKGNRHVYHLYVIRNRSRNNLKKFLSERRIETGIHYPIPVHRQPIFYGDWNLPKTDKICSEILSLPIFPSMTDEEVKFVCENFNEFFK